ncbi:FecR family protein [Agrobacterium sp. BA1120]|uniref:FecR family protein n=1 Tax=Agrobacterium sp. BA1120 TaxID=3228927 RepID=UPI00336A7123
MRKKQSDLPDDGLADEAALWVARMQSSDATEADHSAFQQWLASHPSHPSAYDEMKSLWGDMRDVHILLPVDRKGLGSGRAVAITLGVICLLGLAALLFQQIGVVDRLQADYYTAVGETRVVTLGDGTQVALNTDAAIQIRYTARERRIVLLRGEAFFDVTKNPQRPFIVDSDGLTAKALGTHYSVRAENGSLPQEVQVEEGQVEVATQAGAALLGAGDVVTRDIDGKLLRSKQDVANNTAWREGKLVFSGQPLREVLKVLEQYRHGRIVVLDERAARLNVSGIFDLKDTDQALRILEADLPVAVTRLSGIMVVVRSQ